MSTRPNNIPSVTFPVTTLTDADHVDECVNLRPDSNGDLGAVGNPRVMVSLPGAVPVEGGIYTLPDGTTVTIVLHEGALKAVSSTGRISVIVSAEKLKDAPECILPVDSGIIVMFANSRPQRYDCTSGPSSGNPLSWTPVELFPELPPLMFTRYDMGRIGVDIPEFTLKSSYTTTTQSLGDEDAAKVDSVMRDAYIRLSDSALLRGWYIQPVFARYRLVGRDGRTLYTSAPVIVAPDSGLQGVTVNFTFTGDGFRRMELSRMRANAFIPSITWTRQPDSVWYKLVRSIEVEVTPQLHPYSATLPGTTSRVSSTATQLVLAATLPGVCPDQPFAAPGSRMAGMVTAILDHPDRAFHPDSSIAGSTAEEMANLARINKYAGANPVELSDLEVGLSAPNSFTAKSVARSGDVIVWGGLKAIPFDGYSLPEMGILATSHFEPTPTATHVTMRDGSSVVRAVVSVDRRATALSPLIVYPSPDAVSVTLLSGNDAITLPLVPSPCRRFAYYLDPALKPIEFNEFRDGFAVPSAAPALREYPSAIVSAMSGSPVTPCAVTRGDDTAVLSLQASVRRSNSITAPSSLFYVFSAGGISTLSLSENRMRLALRGLDKRSVKSPQAVTPIPGGVAALAGGALITISGSGSNVHTLLSQCEAEVLAWVNRYGELWCIHPASSADDPAAEVPARSVTIISADGRVRYTREGIGVTSVMSDGAVARLFTPGGDILDPYDETDTPVTIRHASGLKHSYRQNMEITVRAGLYGDELNGSIEVGSSAGAPGQPSHLLCRYDIKGDNHTHPHVMKMRVPQGGRLHLTVSATTPTPSTLKLVRV